MHRNGRERERRPLPPLEDLRLDRLRADQLRLAVRDNLVSFPSQVPVFERHDRPDLQRSVVQLYFTLGWSCEDIAVRYGLIRQRVGQVLRTWKKRAIEMGFIQYIPPADEKLARNGIRVVLSPVLAGLPETRRTDGARPKLVAQTKPVRPAQPQSKPFDALLATVHAANVNAPQRV